MDPVSCSLMHLWVFAESLSYLTALQEVFVLVVKKMCVNTDVSCLSSPSVFSRVRQVHRPQDAQDDTTPVR